MHSVREVYEEANYEEPNFELFLPRNLSYGEESVLDNYSVSSNFATSRNRTPEKTSAFATKTKYVYKILKDTMSGFRDCVTLNGGTDFEDEADDSLKGKQCFHEKETKFNE